MKNNIVLPRARDAMPEEALPDRPVKGRGTLSNRVGRFERQERFRTDDGWRTAESEALEQEQVQKPGTTLAVDAARTIIARNDSPDVPFDRSINPYRGCEHGCVYCFARPTHAYYGLSPGLDFETKLFWKPNAAALLRQELAKPRYAKTVAPIAMGTNTDPYQPVERDREATREILKVLAEYKHPVTIVTKNALVLRDLDILAPMAAAGLASVALSLTTLDNRLSHVMEPRASSPRNRLKAIKGLSEAGVPTSVMTAPILPAINDMEIEKLLRAAWDAGARRAGYVLLRLPLEIADLFEEWLEAHFPDRKDKVLSLVRDTREGALYKSGWGTRLKGTGAYASLIAQRFKIARKRIGYDSEHRVHGLDCAQFTVPPRAGDQLSLL